jgi:hypothetical protein
MKLIVKLIYTYINNTHFNLSADSRPTRGSLIRNMSLVNLSTVVMAVLVAYLTTISVTRTA